MPESPLPAIFTDPLWKTGGLGGAAMLPTPSLVPNPSLVPITAGAGTFSNIETTEQKRNKDYHARAGNPYFIDFSNIATPEQAARFGRGMIDFAENRIASSISNIPTNLAVNATKGEFNPMNTTSFLRLGIEAVKATTSGTMTRGLATSLAGKAASSVIAGTAVGAMIHPTQMSAMSDMSSTSFREWAEAHRQKNLEHEVKVKSIDEEYARKMGNKYAGIEALMETPMWKRDVSPQFTPEERKMQNYEEIIASRYRKLEEASRERDKLENGFYNDKGELMSAHFIRNSK
jgi:hypothetical protein